MSKSNSKANEGLNECTNCDGYGKEECDNCIQSGNSFVVRCPECDGYGKDDNDDTCGECGGDGEVLCDVCDNTGEITCNVCGGIGEVNESKASEVSDDERIRDWLGVMEKNNVSFLSPSMMVDDLGVEWSKANDWIERWNGSLKALRQGYESKASEARKLNARQKKLIEEWVGSMSSPPMMITSDDLPYSLLSELRDINDFDGFDSAIMRYASDIGNKQAMQGSNPYMHSSNYGSFESKASESISDNDKQILGDWVSQNRDWTTIDDLPNEIFIPLMAPFGDDTDKRVEAQVEIINYMKSLGESDMVSESWSQKSSINRIEALERIGVKQGDAIKLSSLEFEDFGEDLQGALKGDLEDAQDLMNKEKDFLDKNQEELDIEQNSTGMPWQQGGEVENPNSEFQQSYPDYNNIGESQTNMTSYECQYCDDGFKSNEALSVHHNDKHAISPESFDGYATETEYAMGNYTDWFVQVDIPNTVQCDYCSAQFNADDQEGMINHINSTHDAGVDPVTGDTGKSWGESKASEDYFEDEDGNLSSVMKWKLVYDDGSDYGVQTDNKAEAQRTVDQWNETNSDRPIKIVSQESKASEFNIGTTMICPICKKEIETGNEDSFYHDGNFYDPNSVPMSYKMQDHFEQEHTAEDFGVQNKNFKGASDGYEAFEDWKTGNQLSLAFRNSFPEYNQDDAIMMNNADKHSTLDSDGNRMPDDYEGESKASEIGMHGGDGASFYNGKTFTCDKCGKVGDSFTDMAQEACPADVNANHQIPIFGDMKKESYAQEDDLDTLMWDNENPDDKDKQWKDKKGKKQESKASEFTPLELYETIEPLWNNLLENDRKKIIINTTNGFVGQDNNVKSNWNQIDHMTQQRIADNWDNAFNMIDEDKKTIYGLESKASELLEIPAELQDLIQNSRSDPDLEELRKAIKTYYEKLNGEGKGYNTWGGYRERQSDMNELEDHINQLIKNAKGKRNQNNWNLYESKASEDHDSNYDYLENRDTQEDHVCAECGFVTSDNSEYLDHLNSHEE